jgi:hypothetical protein
MKNKKAYLSVFCAVFAGLMTIILSQPCIADPPKIDCAVEPCTAERGEAIVVRVESEEQLNSLKVFLKQPKICSAPLVVQDMIGTKCIAIDMKREEGNKYVGRIDTSDLRPGEAIIKTYATSLNKEHATKALAVNIQ